MAEDSEGMEVTLSARTLIIGAFVLGLSTGMVGGLLTASTFSSTIGAPGSNSVDNENEASNSDAANSGDTPKISGTAVEVFTKLASKVGANKQKFTRCLNTSQGREVSEDIMNIRNEEVQNYVPRGNMGTPTFLIGNSEVGYRVVSGAQPLSKNADTNMVDDIEAQIKEVKSNRKSIEENEMTIENISLKGEPSLGGSDSLINVIEYSDYGCPYCSEWAGFEAIPDRGFPYDNYNFKDKLVNQYVENGEVRFIFKDYPVQGLHPNAPKAHVAANCVLEQGENLYWKYHDKLYKYRSSWKK